MNLDTLIDGRCVVYGLGMAIVVSGVTVIVAGGRRSVVERMRSLGRRLDLVSGWVMLGGGIFIEWYWATVLSLGALALGSNPLVRWIDRTSAAITGFVGRNAIGVAMAVLALVLTWLAFDVRRRRHEDGAGPVDGS